MDHLSSLSVSHLRTFTTSCYTIHHFLAPFQHVHVIYGNFASHPIEGHKKLPQTTQYSMMSKMTPNDIIQ